MKLPGAPPCIYTGVSIPIPLREAIQADAIKNARSVSTTIVMILGEHYPGVLASTPPTIKRIETKEERVARINAAGRL